MTIKTTYFPLRGGLNLETPPLAMEPGELIDCANYECLPNGGYRRVRGYELFDGQEVASQEVPGIGSVLGIHVYKNEVYAIREDGTNGRLYKATSSGWVEVDNLFTWSLGGTYRFCNYNFYGQDALEEMFIVNGVDKAVKWDGSSLVQITTGTANDAPKAVTGHRNHLFLAIESSVVNSAIGDPVDYQAINGAAEIAVSDTVREMIGSRGVLLIGCEDSTSILYGTSSADWQLEKLNETGTLGNTMEIVNSDIVGLDRQGVMSIVASQTYGNFSYGTISSRVDAIIKTFGDDSVALYNRYEGQYRIFQGRNGLVFTFDRQELAGISLVSYSHEVKCMAGYTDVNRIEHNYFGSSDGKVYEMDQGYTFDGDPIYAYMVTSFHLFGGPSRNKRFRLLMPDMRVTGEPAELGLRATTDYGAGFISRSNLTNIERTGGALYDYGNWDLFYWDAIYHHIAKARLNLTGSNMAMMISSAGQPNGTHTIYGATIHYSDRRLER